MDQRAGSYFPLDPMQRTAVETGEGVSVVVGGTGTGKTHLVIARVAHLLDSGEPPGHIICLAGRDHSASELRYRLESHPTIKDHLDHLFVGTFQGYANFFLRRAGARVLGISPYYTVWDRQRAVEAVQAAWPERREKNPPKNVIGAALDWHCRNRGIPSISPAYPALDETWLRVERVYQDEKHRQGALDYMDLLVMAVAAMKRDRHVQTEWNSTRSRNLVVDQLEDLTYRQLDLLELMVGPTKSLTVTIDLNLAVDHDDPVSTIGTFLLNHKNRHQHALRLDQVSSKEINQLASALQRNAGKGGSLWDYVRICDGVNGGAPTLVEVEGGLRELRTACLAEAERLADDGTPWEHMAILYRNVGIDRRLETQLLHRDIPHRVLGNDRKEKTGDARLVVALLNCLLNSEDLHSFRIAAAPGHPNRERRLSAGSARRLRERAQDWEVNLMEAARRHLEQLGQGDSDHLGLSWLVRVRDDLDRELQEPRRSLLELVLMALARVREMQPPGLSLVEDPETDVLRRLAAATPRLRDETPRMHLVRFLDRWTTGLDAYSPGLLQERGLTLAPIHLSKGMRWPVVFVLDISDRTMPGKMGEYSDHLGRELRLFYTAVTRASRSLYSYCPADTGRGAAVRPSRFLDPVVHLMERRHVGIREVWAGEDEAIHDRAAPGPPGEQEKYMEAA